MCCPFQLPNQLTEVHETVGTLRHCYTGVVCAGDQNCTILLRALKTFFSVSADWNDSQHKGLLEHNYICWDTSTISACVKFACFFANIYRYNQNCLYPMRSLQFMLLCITYRVSIKSFPHYKHLLQENYEEYKRIYLPLLKLVLKFYVMCLL